MLKRAFKERTVDKIYHALVQGHPDPSRGTIDAPVGRHPVHDYRWAVVAGGKDSVTHYETLEAFAAASLLEIHLETGRTHQIRVHFSALRHPCVGDLTYGADPTLSARLGLQRQWLHAVRLAFTHPVTREPVSVESTYPADLAHALDVIRGEQRGVGARHRESHGRARQCEATTAYDAALDAAAAMPGPGWRRSRTGRWRPGLASRRSSRQLGRTTAATCPPGRPRPRRSSRSWRRPRSRGWWPWAPAGSSASSSAGPCRRRSARTG